VRIEPVRDTDLRLVSVLLGDVERFASESPPTGRKIDASLVARYWKALFEDEMSLFVAFPLTRDKKLVSRLNLAKTEGGKILRKILVEVAILLQLEGKSLDTASTAEIKAQMSSALSGLSRDQWAELVGLAFRIPRDFAPADPPPSRADAAQE
jgi:hypothetical protein